MSIEEWRRVTDGQFRFLFKIPRAYSHCGAISQHNAKILSFFTYVKKHLSGRLGPFFLQLPPSYTAAQGQDLADFLNVWKGQTDHPIAVEFRHSSWFFSPNRERVNLMLHRMQLPRIILDTRPVYESDPIHPCKKPALPVYFERTTSIAFVRYISHPAPEQNRRYLEEWAEVVRDYLSSGVCVYFCIHCPEEEHSPMLAKYFQALLEEKKVGVPPLRWDTATPFPRQQSLF